MEGIWVRATGLRLKKASVRRVKNRILNSFKFEEYSDFRATSRAKNEAAYFCPEGITQALLLSLIRRDLVNQPCGVVGLIIRSPRKTGVSAVGSGHVHAEEELVVVGFGRS